MNQIFFEAFSNGCVWYDFATGYIVNNNPTPIPLHFGTCQNFKNVENMYHKFPTGDIRKSLEKIELPPPPIETSAYTGIYYRQKRGQKEKERTYISESQYNRYVQPIGNM